jgi:hypothetical protein
MFFKTTSTGLFKRFTNMGSGVLCTCKIAKPNRNIDASAATENSGAGICQLFLLSTLVYRINMSHYTLLRNNKWK